MSQAENRNTTTPTRRALLAGAPAVAAAALAGGAAINAVAIAGAKAAEVDPIFAAIERHAAALSATRRALNDESEDLDEATDEEGEAVDALFETEPTTILGVAALIEALARDNDEDEEHGDGSSVLDWEYGSGGIRRRADDFLVELAETLRRLAALPSGVG